jgi:hypothetical protein
MPQDRTAKGGEVTTSTVGMWSDNAKIQDLRDGKAGK